MKRFADFARRLWSKLKRSAPKRERSARPTPRGPVPASPAFPVPVPAVKKPKSEVRFYHGDYKVRQHKANQDGADIYIEHHFNSSFHESADYSLVVVGKKAGEKTIEIAYRYLTELRRAVGIQAWEGGRLGIAVGGMQGRGNYNLKFTKMPALLLEPLFISNPARADFVATIAGRETLARVLVDTVREAYPTGGLIAFSVGHKYKTSASMDRGAPINCDEIEGGLPGWEADLAEDVLQRAKRILEAKK